MSHPSSEYDLGYQEDEKSIMSTHSPLAPNPFTGPPFPGHSPFVPNPFAGPPFPGHSPFVPNPYAGPSFQGHSLPDFPPPESIMIDIANYPCMSERLRRQVY
ncbi:hypothetical protein EJ05DRAFT_480460 [Pseudovirgaria hyperparasitica]|uniref:Uncharacterized protein n=1 Tax=Pseudovirgaria hyperparasitica TaxID=470096 RepID=A0A6A6VS81_9PEZI|nr:uncharacterized protein EJ05DRAFT_480460 [Pseudovirgaria hyperparasitica]KAF2753452.1 hypothetical protein EJ05DRAFT_480460 [Pseudovirgaria hyperparasitica]